MSARGRVLVLWNHTEEDIYERSRAQGPTPLPWNPDQLTPDVSTVAEEMDAVIQGIRACGYEVRLVNIEDDVDRLLAELRQYRPDAVVNMVEYVRDDIRLESWIAGLYELTGVAYTGSGPLALSTCQDKYRTKLLLQAAGLPTPRFMLVERLPVPVAHDLCFPLIVKPALEDASGGIALASVVQDQAALERRVAGVLEEFAMPVLVEEYIHGREIHAGLIGNDVPEVLPLLEMLFDDQGLERDQAWIDPEWRGEAWRPRVVSYCAKWDLTSPEFYRLHVACPAEHLAFEQETAICRIAVEAFRALGCRDYARIDMRVDERGAVYVLEINPNPDLTDGAAYMLCAVASGRTFAHTLGEIIDMAVERGRACQGG